MDIPAEYANEWHTIGENGLPIEEETATAAHTLRFECDDNQLNHDTLRRSYEHNSTRVFIYSHESILRGYISFKKRMYPNALESRTSIKWSVSKAQFIDPQMKKGEQHNRTHKENKIRVLADIRPRRGSRSDMGLRRAPKKKVPERSLLSYRREPRNKEERRKRYMERVRKRLDRLGVGLVITGAEQHPVKRNHTIHWIYGEHRDAWINENVPEGAWMTSEKWPTEWNGYVRQNAIVIKDLDAGMLDSEYFHELISTQPMRAINEKKRYAYLVATEYYITSPYSLYDFYSAISPPAQQSQNKFLEGIKTVLESVHNVVNTDR